MASGGEAGTIRIASPPRRKLGSHFAGASSCALAGAFSAVAQSGGFASDTANIMCPDWKYE